MKWYQSLGVQMSVLIVLLTTFILAGFGMYNYYLTKNRLAAELNDFSDVTATRLSRYLVLPVWSMDKKQAADALESEMLDQKVFTILVRDADKKTIFVGKSRDENWKVIETDEDVKGNYIKKHKEIYRNDKLLGSVEVYTSNKFMIKEFKKMGYQIVIQVAVLDILIFLILLLLIRQKIISQISYLTKSAEKMSKGDLDVRIEVKSSNEIGLLAEALDRMQSSLGIAVQRIKKK